MGCPPVGLGGEGGGLKKTARGREPAPDATVMTWEAGRWHCASLQAQICGF